MWVTKLDVQRVQNFDKIKKFSDCLCSETKIGLSFNGNYIRTLYTTGAKQKELCVGYLLYEGLIEKDTALKIGDFSPDYTLNIDAPKSNDDLSATLDSLEKKTSVKPEEKKDFIITRSQVFLLTAFFQEKAMLFKQTAITESAAIADTDSILAFGEDLSGEQAVCKALGIWRGLKVDKTLCSTPILISSAKLSIDLVMKGYRLGISRFISRVAPTLAAYEFAIANNISLIGFSRNKKFTVYTNPGKEVRL
ncbi:hypothetical protein HOG98_01755 [bacterium]|jgi:FdhD protein|nr:hypothetical protein [bacterium]